MDLAAVIILLTGFGLGLAHSLDPDHVVAVSTLLCNNRSLKKSVVSASAWGIGHSLTLFAIGLIILTFRVAIPESVVTLFELVAGALLIVLGLIVVKPLVIQTFRREITDENTIQHNPSHTEDHLYHNHTHLHKSAIAGGLQGLSGSAALMLVTLTTVSSMEIGLVFIFLFGIGLILGMVCISCLVGSVIAYTAKHLEKVHLIIKAVTGTASIVLGFAIIISLTF